MITAATYWRRRVVALVLGIALFATLAWAANGALKTPAGLAGQEHSDHRGQAHSQAHGGGRGGAPGTPAGGGPGHQQPGRDSPSSSPGTNARPGTGPGSGGPGGKDGRDGSGPGSQPGGGGGAHDHGPGTGRGHSTTGTSGKVPAACPAGQVVLTLFMPRYWYGRGQRPEFVVTAVSRRTQPCRFSLGQVAVAISTGHTVVWNSTACLAHPQARVTTLAHGVPAALWVSWDRHVNRPACGGRHLARPRTYTATAVSGHLRSPTLIFVLSAPGIAVP